MPTLPKTLDETYERIPLDLDKKYGEDALKIFQRLCFSQRPMLLNEKVEELATDSTPHSLFKPQQKFQDLHDILSDDDGLVHVPLIARWVVD